MTRLDTDPTNYVYTITYLPDNIDNGTVVTVSGSSIYAGVSKSFAFSFTGTKSTMQTAYFPINFVITDSSGEPIQSEFSHGKISITTGNMKYGNDFQVDKTDLSLSGGSFYGYYECEYDSSNTNEYVCSIIDYITIEVNQMYPSTFGANHYVNFGLVLDGALSDNALNETITIHSPRINSGTGTWNSGTATLQYAGLLVVQVNINNISESSLSGQCWTDSVNETFDSLFTGYVKDTNNQVKARLSLSFDIIEG